MYKPRILLMGETLIDEWVYGSVSRISPEAPVPILDVESSTINIGGAGNVLVNLKSIGVDPIFLTGVSEDKDGHLLKKMIRDLCGMDQLYFNIPESFRKKRICSGQQQIVRIDTGIGGCISDVEIDEYLDKLKGKLDVIGISDYGKLMINSNILKKASDFCISENIKLLIDPYKKNYYNSDFSCDMIKLNKDEAEWFSGEKYRKEGDLKIIGDRLLNLFNSKGILVTLGPKGMVYFDRDKYLEEPYRRNIKSLKIFDVAGAGDSVFSTLLYLISNQEYDIEDIIDYALKTGNIAVSKKGTSVVTYNELFGE